MEKVLDVRMRPEKKESYRPNSFWTTEWISCKPFEFSQILSRQKGFSFAKIGSDGLEKKRKKNFILGARVPVKEKFFHFAYVMPREIDVFNQAKKSKKHLPFVVTLFLSKSPSWKSEGSGWYRVKLKFIKPKSQDIYLYLVAAGVKERQTVSLL